MMMGSVIQSREDEMGGQGLEVANETYVMFFYGGDTRTDARGFAGCTRGARPGSSR